MRALVATILVAALATNAAAEPAAGDQPIALALFEEGKQLATSGDFTAACPKFEAAARLTHWLGVELNLADCYEHLGRTASAWILFLKAADHADRDHDPRGAYARSRAESLAPSLARLTITTAEPAHADTALELRIDRVVVDTNAFGIALPLDPGEHVVEVSAPGRVTFSRRLVLTAGATTTLEIPTLEIRTLEAPTLDAPTLASASSPSEPRPGRSHHPFARWLGGAGALLAGTSVVFGIDAKLRYDAATREHCDAHIACDDVGLDAIRSARRRGDIATVTGIAGVAAMAGAVVIYALSPREHAVTVTPVSTPTSFGLALEGKL
jgi:hypothetical protein